MMTPEQYRAALAALGLSQVEAARLLAADARTSRRWALGERPVPALVANLLRAAVAGKIDLKDIAQ